MSGNQIRWSTVELQRDFEVLGFSAPFMVVIRKSDRQKGVAGVHPPAPSLLQSLPHEEETQ